MIKVEFKLNDNATLIECKDDSESLLVSRAYQIGGVYHDVKIKKQGADLSQVDKGIWADNQLIRKVQAYWELFHATGMLDDVAQVTHVNDRTVIETGTAIGSLTENKNVKADQLLDHSMFAGFLNGIGESEESFKLAVPLGQRTLHSATSYLCNDLLNSFYVIAPVPSSIQNPPSVSMPVPSSIQMSTQKHVVVNTPIASATVSPVATPTPSPKHAASSVVSALQPPMTPLALTPIASATVSLVPTPVPSPKHIVSQSPMPAVSGNGSRSSLSQSYLSLKRRMEDVMANEKKLEEASKRRDNYGKSNSLSSNSM